MKWLLIASVDTGHVLRPVACVNFRRPEWGLFVQLDGSFPNRLQGKHAVYQVSLAHRIPHPYVEWSGKVTSAGSTIGGGMV